MYNFLVIISGIILGLTMSTIIFSKKLHGANSNNIKQKYYQNKDKYYRYKTKIKICPISVSMKKI